MKKILMLLDNAFKPDLRVQKEINTLNAMGFNIWLFCWDRDSDLPESVDNDSLKIRRIKVKTGMQLGAKQAIWLLKFFRSSLKKIKREKQKFDFIYVHDLLMLPLGVYLKLRKGIPLIYDAHEIYHLMEWEKYNSFIRNFIFAIEKFFLKFVNHLIVVNQVRKDFYKKYFQGEILVLGNWYDPYTEEKNNLRNELGIPEEGIVMGYFGALDRRERCLDLMINSVLEIPNGHLLIAGNGFDTKYVQEFADKNSRIHFLGWKSNIRKYFNTLDYVLYFINSENKYFNYAAPNTLYLSISHAVPLITNVPGEPESLIKEYNIGFFIEKDEKIIDKIELNTKSVSYKEMINNIACIKNNYSWFSSFDIYSRIFGTIKVS